MEKARAAAGACCSMRKAGALSDTRYRSSFVARRLARPSACRVRARRSASDPWSDRQMRPAASMRLPTAEHDRLVLGILDCTLVCLSKPLPGRSSLHPFRSAPLALWRHPPLIARLPQIIPERVCGICWSASGNRRNSPPPKRERGGLSPLVSSADPSWTSALRARI